MGVRRKLDGYRLEAIKDGDKVRLYSRRGNDFTKKFATIATKASRIKESSFVLDGEAVCCGRKRKAIFSNAAESQFVTCRLVACILHVRPVALNRK